MSVPAAAAPAGVAPAVVGFLQRVAVASDESAAGAAARVAVPAAAVRPPGLAAVVCRLAFLLATVHNVVFLLATTLVLWWGALLRHSVKELLELLLKRLCCRWSLLLHEWTRLTWVELSQAPLPQAPSAQTPLSQAAL